MANTDDRQHRSILQGIAHRMMLEGGLVPDLPIQVLAKLDGAHGPAIRTEESTCCLRNLLWCSTENDDSRDLDQLTVAEAMPAGASKILVAIADVDAVVKKHLTIMCGKTPPRSTPLPRCFRCYPRNSPPILLRSTMNQIPLPQLFPGRL